MVRVVVRAGVRAGVLDCSDVPRWVVVGFRGVVRGLVGVWGWGWVVVLLCVGFVCVGLCGFVFFAVVVVVGFVVVVMFAAVVVALLATVVVGVVVVG